MNSGLRTVFHWAKIHLAGLDNVIRYVMMTKVMIFLVSWQKFSRLRSRFVNPGSTNIVNFAMEIRFFGHKVPLVLNIWIHVKFQFCSGYHLLLFIINTNFATIIRQYLSQVASFNCHVGSSIYGSSFFSFLYTILPFSNSLLVAHLYERHYIG